MAPPQPGGSIDHIHQKSGWLAYGDVIPAGADVSPRKKGVEGVDYWAEVPVHGRIVCIDRHKMDDGRAAVRNEWRTPAGAVILDETQAWGLHDLGAGWLLCVETALRARGDGVTFGDTKEGMFGVRVHDLLRSGTGKEAGSGRITNAHAKSGEKECWGRLADWCDVSGTIDGKAVGIALFDDPANKYRSCWHVRGYGLMAANPFGRQKSGFPDMKGKTDRVALAKGEQLILRYAVYTHGGDEKTGKVADAFAKFMELSRK